MVSVYPVFTVKVTPFARYKLLTVTLEFNNTEPLFTITSVLASGKFPQLQFAPFSQVELTAPVHTFEKISL